MIVLCINEASLQISDFVKRERQEGELDVGDDQNVKKIVSL